MCRSRVVFLAAGALLPGLLPLVAAHDDNHDSSGTAAMTMATPKPLPVAGEDAPQSYWGLASHANLLYIHIALMMISWAVLLPIGVMLSIARSRWTIPSQFFFALVNAFGLLTGIIYNRSTPDLYPNNSHHKIGWISSWLASGWVIFNLIGLYAGYTSRTRSLGYASHPMTAATMAQYSRLQNEEPSGPARWSGDSGQGTEQNSASLASDVQSPSVESDRALHNARFHHEEDEDDDINAEKRGFLKDTAVDRFLSHNIPKIVAGRTLQIIKTVYMVLDRTLIILGFVAFATGTVVFGGIGRGSAVFNVLAHYIKGAIFFWYGLLTLGRWMGMFADFGWAWNVKPPKEVVGRFPVAVPTAEFTESFVIFLYGISNVFLEHLAAWGSAWTAQDLEHVSISVMFFGGGLLGMLIESKKIRELLNISMLSTKEKLAPPDAKLDNWEKPPSWRVPLNPLPALVILLLGLMMSGHHQSSMLSTMVHKQWGTLFVAFALARGVTYILLYISPPTTYLPARPPSEIITSFCLISGGITFVVSNKDTIAALESYGLDAMFTFIVTISGTALIMAWAMFVCAVKGWAIRRGQRATISNSHQMHFDTFVGQSCAGAGVA